MSLYGTSLALLTDLYQLSMGQTYFDQGMHETRATFNLYFRKAPFGGAYAVAAGIGDALDYIDSFKVTEEDICYLMDLVGNDGKPLFTSTFLNYLRRMDLKDLKVHAVREGSVVFPNEPILRIDGPLLKAQLIETALLNIVNFQTLIATKAARIAHVAKDRPVLEFGLRRAQGIDGGLTASKAAFIGGCAATSNVLAGRLYGIPVKGTHAHSMVMAFGDERAAFKAYAKSQPNNLTLLVDTYDTIEGIKEAIETARTLPAGTPFGIRLDSGDLAALSKEARKMLNEAGFAHAKIVASSDLDEYEIAKLDEQGAQIDIFGVGTNLVTAKDQPALGGVYKLTSIHNGTTMVDRIKLSENPAKTSIPGILNVIRYYNDNGERIQDVIFDEMAGRRAPGVAVTLTGETLNVGHFRRSDTLLVPGGGIREPLKDIRERAKREIAALPERYRALKVAEAFPVALDTALNDNRQKLIAQVKEGSNNVVSLAG